MRKLLIATALLTLLGCSDESSVRTPSGSPIIEPLELEYSINEYGTADVSLEWLDNTSDEQEYLVMSRPYLEGMPPDFEGVTAVIKAYLPANSESYVDEDVPPGMVVCYKVVASTPSNKIYSNEACIKTNNSDVAQ